MDWEDFFFGAVGAFILVALLAVAFNIGQSDVASDCDSIGIVMIDGKKYECREIKEGGGGNETPNTTRERGFSPAL